MVVIVAFKLAVNRVVNVPCSAAVALISDVVSYYVDDNFYVVFIGFGTKRLKIRFTTEPRLVAFGYSYASRLIQLPPLTALVTIIRAVVLRGLNRRGLYSGITRVFYSL